MSVGVPSREHWFNQAFVRDPHPASWTRTRRIPRVDVDDTTSHVSLPNVLLSGSLCSGKSTLAGALAARGYTVVTALDVIESHVGRRGLSRRELQRVGRALEDENPGQWLADAARQAVQPVVLDSVRTRAQLRAARSSLHRSPAVHLSAAPSIRRARFELRAAFRQSDKGVGFDDVVGTALETEANSIGYLADYWLDTDELSPEEVVQHVVSFLRTISEHPHM